MTDPSEVKISDAEVLEFMRAHAEAVMKGNPGPLPPHMRPDTAAMEKRSIEYTRQALADFLARRVPDAMAFKGVAQIVENPTLAFKIDAHNACRARVLKGE